MSKNRIGIILLLLLLTVGFATVTANLIINNNANISANTGDFDVIFYSAIADEESSAIISNDKKTITYNTKELVEVGDRTELTYEIKNNSSQYDADINMVVTLDNNYSDYFRITYEGIDVDNTVNILAKEIKEGKITIELIKPFIDNTQISITVTFNGNAVERESIAYDTYTVRFNPNGGTGEMDDQTIGYLSSINLNKSNYKRDNYVFIGWTDDINSNVVKYKDEQEVLSIADPNGVIELYALWTEKVKDYTYNNSYYVYDVLVDGEYKIEAWGAQGGNAKYGTQYYGGNGGYTSGNIKLKTGDKLYIYVGGMGVTHSGTSSDIITYNGYGYNGGGPNGVFYSNNSNGGGGGGATDIRYFQSNTLTNEDLVWNSDIGLKSRIMVAAGGAGGDSHANAPSWSGNGGPGGGLSGYNANRAGSCYSYGQGASQTAAGISVSCGSGYNYYYLSGFGYAGTSHTGGGGGYYGGGAGQHTSAGGGSSFISGYPRCNAIDESGTHTGQPNHFSGKVFTDGVMIDGNGCNWSTGSAANCGTYQVQPNGSLAKGHTGNGYARITFVE